MKFHIISMGCSKNTADSEKIANRFAAHGWQWSPEPEAADLLLINTCGFISDAKEESLNAIMTANEYKKTRPGIKTAVFGCLVRRYRNEIKEQIPEVDYLYEFLSDDELDFLVHLSGPEDISPDYSQSWRFFTPPHIGILKIAEGCSNCCSYCAIPGIRGHFFSRPEAEILADARQLANSGAREISVVAQDITRYGTENNKPCGLPRLVRKIAEIPGIEWIRLHYMHPRGLTTLLIDKLFSIKKVLPYFDIPFQHISERMLKLMNRNTSPEHIRELITYIRNKFPEAAIRTTFIVGFPGEREQDFNELIAFVEEYPIDRVGAFMYSTEEGTAAALMRPKVSMPVKQARLDQLMTLQQLIITERNLRLVGQKVQVIIDDVSDDIARARTRFDAFEVDNTTIIENPGKLKTGDIVSVKITAADAYDFKAELLP